MEQATRIELVSQPWQGRIITIILCLHMEQIKGIEPLSTAWKAEVLPLNYICMVPPDGLEPPRDDYKSPILAAILKGQIIITDRTVASYPLSQSLS